MVKVLKGCALLVAVLVLMGGSFSFAEDGKAVYDKQKCGVCHGKNGEGKMGPKLAKTKLGEKELKKVILDGKKAKKGAPMPAFKGKIKDADLGALVKFLQSLK